MSADQKLERVRDAVAELRHLYANMVNGCCRDTAQAKRLAEGLLSPAIEKIEAILSTEAPASPAVRPLPEVLAGVVELAKVAHGHWDADRDAKVGKILMALAGWNEGYDRRADNLHAAIRSCSGIQGEQT